MASKATKTNLSFLDGSSHLQPGLLTRGLQPDPGQAGWVRLDRPHSSGLQAALCSAWLLSSSAELGLWASLQEVGGLLGREAWLEGDPASSQGLVPRGISSWNPTPHVATPLDPGHCS